MIFRSAILALIPLTVLLAGCGDSVAPAASQAGPGGPPPPVTHTDAEWRKLLTPQQYEILRQKGTEAPFSGKYDNFYQAGTYVCAACGQELFTSTTKFDAGCGWPSFYAAAAGDKVKLVPDYSGGEVRTEVICANCGSHLGHLFDDAPQTPTGNRYCIDSAALKFIPAATQPGTQAASKPDAAKP